MERFPVFNKQFFHHSNQLSLAMSLLLLLPGVVHATQSVYDLQIQQARNGNYAPFLDSLRQYQRLHALNPQQVADWLQVALWAGRDDEVIRVWQRYQVYMPLPARGIAAAAQAYRNLHHWPLSLDLWDRAISLAPGTDDYRIGRIKTLADARKDTQALDEARQLVAAQPTVAHLQTLSYVYLRQGKSWDRLLSDTRALNTAPENKEALNNLINSLTLNRIDSPALALSKQSDLSPAARRALEINAAAERVRLADTRSRGEKERFSLARQALENYDRIFSRWRNDPQAAADLTRARIDRLGALYAHGDYTQAIAEYESLTAEQVRIPDWAIGWVISSYLAEKKVDVALSVARQHPETLALPQDEGHEIFFALLDSGRYKAAHQYVERLSKSSPYHIYALGSTVPEPNDRWLEAQSLNFQYLLATNALPQAQTLAQRLAATAPGNQKLRIDYAMLLQARGLPGAAEQELKTAEALEPSNIDLERQQAYVAMDLQQWRQMDLLTDDVMARTPGDLSSQRLARVRQVHHMSELRINATKGIHANSPVSGSRDLNWDTAIYGPPLADNWRLFAGTRFAQSNFTEGKGSSRNLFGGIEWRRRDYRGELEVSNNHFHGTNKPGLRLSAWHRLNDNWQTGGEIERLSGTTPLRALRNGVHSNRGEVWVRWYQNEQREYRLSAAASDFSDNNRRQEYLLSGKEQLWQTPTLTLDLEPGLSFSANSRSDTMYYNPKRDLSAAAALTANHVIYQRYETVWSQQMAVGGGSYWQKNHAPGAIALLGYGQRIRLNSVIDAGVMLNWDKRPYDGKRESNLSVSFDTNLRF